MELGELLDDLTRPYAVEATDDGDRLVAMRLADNWGVGMRLHRRGTHRQWNIREITLRMTDTDASISGYDVRELPLGALISEARRIATKNAGAASEPRTNLAGILKANDGRFGSGDEALAALALEYVSMVEAGVRTPSKSLVERFGGSAGSWTNRVALARRSGFLTAVGRGEAGGALTEKARRVLGISTPDA
ncbi:hypothetical protein GCM10022234_30650 [Aeromicrobium panaciterrae]|uniref:hypothetical protein n=1 Tax=Aeromicrobium panaciterrae TaxID=363861 RepID=UPI0031D1868A